MLLLTPVAMLNPGTRLKRHDVCVEGTANTTRRTWSSHLGGQNLGGARPTYNDYGTLRERDRLCRHCGCLVAWLTPGAGGAGLDTVRHARCLKCNDTGEAEADK
jgi:hypothetical protein